MTKELKAEEAGATALWSGLNNKYFAALMIPDPTLEAEYRFEELADNGEAIVGITHPKETASLVIPEFTLRTGQSRTDYFRVYVGPEVDFVLEGR